MNRFAAIAELLILGAAKMISAAFKSKYPYKHMADRNTFLLLSSRFHHYHHNLILLHEKQHQLRINIVNALQSLLQVHQFLLAVVIARAILSLYKSDSHIY